MSNGFCSCGWLDMGGKCACTGEVHDRSRAEVRDMLRAVG